MEEIHSENEDHKKLVEDGRHYGYQEFASKKNWGGGDQDPWDKKNVVVIKMEHTKKLNKTEDKKNAAIKRQKKTAYYKWNLGGGNQGGQDRPKLLSKIQVNSINFSENFTYQELIKN